MKLTKKISRVLMVAMLATSLLACVIKQAQ